MINRNLLVAAMLGVGLVLALGAGGDDSVLLDHSAHPMRQEPAARSAWRMR